MTERRLIIGSRGSDLALIQAGIVQAALRDRCGGKADIKVIKTQGDRLDQLAFEKMEGKGFFTKELEEALLAGSIDLAVHSMKDLPTSQTVGLNITAVGFRADRRELLLMRPGTRDGSEILPVRSGGVIGTSSSRRKAQIAFHNPTLATRDLRGNVPTRIRKLGEGQFDAIVIAASGPERLGLDLSDLDAVWLKTEDFVPAPAQGVLAIQTRRNDDGLTRLVQGLNDPLVESEVAVERGLLTRFQSGCSLPLGVYAESAGEGIRVIAALGVPENGGWGKLKKVDMIGPFSEKIIDEVYDVLMRD